ncbi:MAG: DegT/DnrJ/EryC1/StrS family aminotransferase [Rhodanobacteraceae bacterium]
MSWSDWWPLGRRGSLRPPGIDEAQYECSGTAALVVALRTLQRMSPRSDVIVPAYTCPLVAIAIAECGLRVRLCDTRPGHFDMDQDALARMCDADTLAVVPTHLGGRVADVAHAIVCAHLAGAWVIEDAAQAWGACADGKPVGLLGDIGFFSLAVGKGITTYEGGVLVSRDPALREGMRALAHATVPFHPGWETLRLAQLFAYTALYRPLALRVVYAWPRSRALARGDWIGAVGDSFAASIPLHRMSRWRRRIGERSALRWPVFSAALRAQAGRRIERLERIGGVHVIQDRDVDKGAWPFFLVRLPNPRMRDAILHALAGSPFGVSRLFVHALPDYDYLSSCISQSKVPNARAFAACTLTITNSPWLDDPAFEQLARRIGQVLRELRSMPGASAIAH